MVTRTGYAMSTSSTVLRGHLKKRHGEAYTATCLEYGWISYLPENDDGGQDSTPHDAPAPFTSENFMRALVRWVCADDQACIFTVLHFDGRKLIFILELESC